MLPGRPSRSLFIVFVLAGVVAGCGDDGFIGDAGSDGSVDHVGDGAVLVTPPDIPWLLEGAPPIMLAPCPLGWREVPGGTVIECDPYPEAGPRACDPGEAHFPGEMGCRPIGDPCPVGDYAPSVPSGAVVYVNASAAAGGDGTRAAPFATLSDVPWSSLAASTAVALGKGTYRGVLPLKAGLRVIGACAAQTILTGLAAPIPAVVSVISAGEPAVVENLTIRGAPQRGAMADRGRSLSLRGVLIDRASIVGVCARDAGSEVSLADVVIRDAEAGGAAAYEAGLGIFVESGAHLTATRLLVLGNHGAGVFGTDDGVTLTLADTAIIDTRARETDRGGGRGITMVSGATLDAARLLVSGSESGGVFLEGDGTAATLTDAIIRDTESRPRDGLGGRGVTVQAGAEVTGTRLLVANNRGIGVFVNEPGARATLADVVIRDTRPPESGSVDGRGIAVQFGARLDATRMLNSRNAGVAMYVSGAETVAAVVDTVIEDTVPTMVVDSGGRGIAVSRGARFNASRLLVTDNREVGLVVAHDGTAVGLSDVVIRNTRSRPSDGRFGGGLEGQGGALIEGTRLEVVESVGLGVLAHSGASLVLSDASVRGVALADCATAACPEEHNGYGAGAYSASLSMKRFRVTEAATCGVMVSAMDSRSEGGALDLDVGVVSGSVIGACVQVDGYDFGRLTHEVHYTENGTNLDTTTLPVPGVVGTVAP